MDLLACIPFCGLWNMRHICSWRKYSAIWKWEAAYCRISSVWVFTCPLVSLLVWPNPESECTPSTKFLPEISLPVFRGSHRAVKVTSSAQILRGRRVDFLSSAWEPTTNHSGASFIRQEGVQRLSTFSVGEKYSRSRFWGRIVFPVHGNQPQPRCLILRARFWNQPTAHQPQFQRNILDLDFEGPCAMCMGTNRHPATTQVPPPWRKILEKCSRFRFWGQLVDFLSSAWWTSDQLGFLYE